MDRLRLRPLLAALIFTVGLNAPVVAVATVNRLWSGDANRIGLQHDYGWWVLSVTAIPATFFFFFWMSSGIRSVLGGLRKSRVLAREETNQDTSDRLAAFEARFTAAYSHWGWILLSLVLVAIYMFVLSVPVQRLYRNWQTTGPFIFWYLVFFWTVVFAAGSMVLVRGLVAIRWFNQLVREFDVNVRVLHPDGAGGLSPLGGFSVKIGYLIGIYALAAVVASLSPPSALTGKPGGLLFPATLWPLLVVYLLVAPIAFFAPIKAAGKAMKEAKAAFILEISNQFDVDSSRLLSLLDSDAATLRDNVSKIEQLQKLHEIGMRFPVWPFNTGNLVRFFSSVLLPLLVAALPTVVSLVLQRPHAPRLPKLSATHAHKI